MHMHSVWSHDAPCRSITCSTFTHYGDYIVPFLESKLAVVGYDDESVFALNGGRDASLTQTLSQVQLVPTT